jgi:hypothetical protein
LWLVYTHPLGEFSGEFMIRCNNIASSLFQKEKMSYLCRPI